MKNIIAIFRNHEPVLFTEKTLDLLKSDPGVVHVIDADTGKIIYTPEKTYRNVELTKSESDILHFFLMSHNIEAHLSECYNMIHFDIKCSTGEAALIDAFLSTFQ